MKKIIIIILVVILGIATTVGIIKFKEEEEFNNKLEEYISFQAYILPEYENNVEEIGKKIKEIKGIKSVDFVSKEEAFNMTQEEKGEELMEGLSAEVFSCSFIIHCRIKELEGTYFDEIEQKIEDIEGIEVVTSNYNSIITMYEEKGEEGVKNYINNLENLDKLLEEYIEQERKDMRD